MEGPGSLQQLSSWSRLQLINYSLLLLRFPARQFSVRLGDVDLARDDEPSRPVTLRVTEVRAHDQFSRVGFYNDIAILVLSGETSRFIFYSAFQGDLPGLRISGVEDVYLLNPLSPKLD